MLHGEAARSYFIGSPPKDWRHPSIAADNSMAMWLGWQGSQPTQHPRLLSSPIGSSKDPQLEVLMTYQPPTAYQSAMITEQAATGQTQGTKPGTRFPFKSAQVYAGLGSHCR